ncbi:protein TIFY 10a-like [Papaver somniferum]|uniref:protein TIFY 10a-like n=1 Tax=Papaver somniferum TaxID=3469 RepID=UPI000E704C8C|nr:protein TIFY 10a-like [Papaver somniferum]
MSSSSAKEMMKSKSFSQTCDLLSEYMKGNKGGFGPPAMNLASSAQASLTGNSSSACNPEVKSMGLFPQQHASFGRTPNTIERKSKSESPQMTIFYGGKIMVLDNLTADNAKQVLGFAENFSGSYIVNTRETQGNSVVPVNKIRKDLLPPSHQQRQQQQQRPIPIASGGSSSLYINASDVPAAKNLSLQRFLAKRKERIIARAPYQVKASSSSTPKDSQAKANVEMDESKTWLGLGPKSTPPMEI